MHRPGRVSGFNFSVRQRGAFLFRHRKRNRERCHRFRGGGRPTRGTYPLDPSLRIRCDTPPTAGARPYPAGRENAGYPRLLPAGVWLPVQIASAVRQYLCVGADACIGPAGWGGFDFFIRQRGAFLFRHRKRNHPRNAYFFTFSSASDSCEMSLGDTPGIRPAWASVRGRIFASFSRASSVRVESGA